MTISSTYVHDTDGTAITDAESRLLIAGELRAATGGGRFDNVDPATEELVGQVADATGADMEAAIVAARQAFGETGWASNASRAEHIRQLQAGLERHKERIVGLLAAEAGVPVSQRVIWVDRAIQMLDYWATLAETYDYDQVLPERPHFGVRANRCLIAQEPIGVVGAITPFNSPFYLNLIKIVPALAAGCTVVLKAAPDTPWSATEIGRVIAQETDIPPGVVNIITGADHALGQQLCEDPRVDMVTFTGSTATGSAIMRSSAATIKRVSLELGGKSAALILDDADLVTVVPGEVGNACRHAGQGCALHTRLLLPRSRYEEALEIAREAMAGIKWGDPYDPSVTVGPVINARQRDRVLGFIESGRREGGRVVLGGRAPSTPDRGFFVEPTLFADVDPQSTIAQQEIFGPVICAIPYDTVDEAVQIANATRFGLSGGVWSGDDERALQVARRLRTGTLTVNGKSWSWPDIPFGGYGFSGNGYERGERGLEEFLVIKSMGLPG